MSRAASRSRVFIVDDHPVCRVGLRAMLERAGDFEVCGEAEDGPTALELLRRAKADVVIIDIVLKGASGLELLRQLKTEQPQLPTLLMTMQDEGLFAERALRSGASGYMRKDAPEPEVIAAVRQVLSGHVAISEEFRTTLLSRLTGHRGGRAATNPGAPAGLPVDDALSSLTDREHEILHLLGKGLSTRDCAEQLHLSIKTIEAHQASLKAKLGLGDVNQLRRYAAIWVSRGLAQP